jgi:hypothetical protein
MTYHKTVMTDLVVSWRRLRRQLIVLCHVLYTMPPVYKHLHKCAQWVTLKSLDQYHPLGITFGLFIDISVHRQNEAWLFEINHDFKYCLSSIKLRKTMWFETQRPTWLQCSFDDMVSEIRITFYTSTDASKHLHFTSGDPSISDGLLCYIDNFSNCYNLNT